MTLTRRLFRMAQRRLAQSLRRLWGEMNYPAPSVTRRPPQPPPPRHPYEAEYHLLGAPVGASPETLRRCWRKRVREWHPDRFSPDPVAMQAAAEQLRRINDAYQRLAR